MDWIAKGLITLVGVAAILALAEVWGRRWAGVLAGMPTVSAPTLIWLSVERGASYATTAAAGTVIGCAVCAVFAFGYERASRRVGALAAVALATLAAAACSPLAGAASSNFVASVVLAIGCVIGLYRLMPAPNCDGEKSRPNRGRMIWSTAVIAGATSAIVGLLSQTLQPILAGTLASMPLIAASVALQQHRTTGARAAASFLHGYVAGLRGRIAFGVALALLPHVVPFAGALALALALSVAMTLSLAGPMAPNARRAGGAGQSAVVSV